MHAQTAQHVAALSSDAASAVVSSVSPDANAQQQCAADESSMQQGECCGVISLHTQSSCPHHMNLALPTHPVCPLRRLPRLHPVPTPIPCPTYAVLLPKPASSAYKHPISVARRHYTVVLVALIAALLSADQNLLAPNVSCCMHSHSFESCNLSQAPPVYSSGAMNGVGRAVKGKHGH